MQGDDNILILKYPVGDSKLRVTIPEEIKMEGHTTILSATEIDLTVYNANDNLS